MEKGFDVNRYIEAVSAHGIEADALENAVKKAINDNVKGIKIDTVCLSENLDKGLSFQIWGKLAV